MPRVSYAAFGKKWAVRIQASMLGQTPKEARLLVRAYSPDLVEVIRDINKYSNNTMAKQLFLTIGARFRSAADSDDAAAA